MSMLQKAKLAVEKALLLYPIGKLANAFMHCKSGDERKHLYFVGDFSNWVLSWELREVAEIAQSLGISVDYGLKRLLKGKQAVFFANQGDLIVRNWKLGGHNAGFAYFHGKPGTSDVFTRSYEELKNNHDKITRIQASHTEMRDIILESGINEDKVHLIPIGLNETFFKPQTAANKKLYREKYGVPQDATVIGSFQKDGNGWGEGLTPKLIKGPDIFVKSLEQLKQKIDNLHVLLSGPARGFVKTELKKLGITYTHHYLDHYPKIGELFQCLDAYIVSSRQEGGPKAILESMASGVPIISTHVGQAMDIVEHDVNGFLVPIEDVDAIAAATLKVLEDSSLRERTTQEGIKTAARHTYQKQTPLWENFMQGFVEMNQT